MCFMMIFIIFIVNIIKYFFKILNMNLNQTIINLEQKVIFQETETLQTIFKLHNEVQKLIKKFSSAFGLAILGCFLYCIGSLTVQVYMIYITLESENVNYKEYLLLYIWLNILWTIPMISLQSILGFKCVQTKLEAEKINFLMRSELLREQQRNEVILISWLFLII